MDAFLREMEGRRHGRVCPCCSATRTKRGDTRRTRARFKADGRRAIGEALEGKLWSERLMRELALMMGPDRMRYIEPSLFADEVL